MQNIDIEKIYNEYFKIVYKYLISLTYDQDIAEDITQETFCKATTHIKEFRGDCKISVWLCQIAKNLWFNELKKKNRIFIEDIDMLNIVEPHNIEDEYTNKEEIKLLYKKIEQLDKQTQEIFRLKLVGNLNFKEIGEIMQKNEVWARVNYYRAKQKLKEVNEIEK